MNIQFQESLGGLPKMYYLVYFNNPVIYMHVVTRLFKCMSMTMFLGNVCIYSCIFDCTAPPSIYIDSAAVCKLF